MTALLQNLFPVILSLSSGRGSLGFGVVEDAECVVSVAVVVPA